MDSNNNVNSNNTSALDIRDIVNFLLSKAWIIALVVLCFAIIAFLWTELIITEQYSSTTDMFIISSSGATQETASNQISNWSVGKQLTKTSIELIMGDYCDYVALHLTAHNAQNPVTDQDKDLTKALNSNNILAKNMSFMTFYKEATKKDSITGSDVRSYIRVTSDDETCIVSVTATTTSPGLSAAISNAALALFGDYINDFMEGDNNEEDTTAETTVKTKISSSGKVPSNPSNKNSMRNAIIFGIIGAAIICAILIMVFIFDDKIKTPDDVEKQLGLSVLGAIPEIDEA